MAGLLVLGSAGDSARAVLSAARAAGLDARAADAAAAGPEAPDAVIVDAAAAGPIELARTAKGLWPDAPIAFALADERSAREFEASTRLATLLGTYQSLRADDPELGERLRRLSAAGRQRRRFRTMLASARRKVGAVQDPVGLHREKVLSEPYLASILRSSPDAIITVDLSGRVTAWNLGAERLFGPSEAEAAGRTLEELTALGYNPVSGGPEGEVTVGEGGARRSFDIRRGPVVDDGARLVGYSLIIRDVTERRRLVEELGRARAELEDQVARRTAELRASNEELEAFAYSVAHDLRSPLRSIHSFTSLTLRSFADRLPVEAQDYLRRASDAALRLAKMIDALLDLSRLTRRPLDRRPLDLTALARRLFEETGPDRAGRTVDFSAHEGLEARADEKLVEAILRNLIGNAVKFTRDSSPARIEVGRSDDGWFYVKDNGVGFDDAYAGKIFEPFQRLHPNAGFPGTGIGLAVVQRATARHGGRVRATAAPGRGATFWFTLEPAPVKG